MVGGKNSALSEEHLAEKDPLVPKSGRAGLAVGLLAVKRCFQAAARLFWRVVLSQ